MIEKRIVVLGEKQELLNPDPAKDFPIGTKFFLNGHKYVVREKYADSGTEFRKIMSEGNEEVLTLHSLREDAKLDKEFKILTD